MGRCPSPLPAQDLVGDGNCGTGGGVKTPVRTLKTLGITLVVAAITAGSVVWYIDYKVDQVTEAVMAPVYETEERFETTISEIGESVVTSMDAVDATLETAGDRIADDLEGARAAVQYEIEKTRDLRGKVLDWVDSLTSG